MKLEDPAAFETLRLWLRRWTETHEDSLRQKGVEVELDLEEGKTDKQMVALELEGSTRMGQLLLWRGGEAELGVIEVSSEEEVLVETRGITSLFGLQESLCAVTSAVLGEEAIWPLPLE